MKNVGFAGLALLGLGALVVAMLAMPTANVVAQGENTPVPFGDLINPPSNGGNGGGGLVIPTATPAGGGLTIPTATPFVGSGGGGLVIPTATPSDAGQAGGFGPLNDTQLQAMNLQPEDVPPQFAANAQVETTNLDEVIPQLREAGLTELADLLEQMGNQYGWTYSVGVNYTYCDPSLPISAISSDISPMFSVEAARAFIESAELQQLFEMVGQVYEPASQVHGYYVTVPPDSGECFAQETEYRFLFDYWGVVVSLSMTANAETDPSLVRGLLEQLLPVIQARLDAAAPTPFPPTPAPEQAAMPPQPPAQPPAQPPQPPAQPPAQPPQPPAQPPAGAKVTLADLERVMPSLSDLGLPVPPFQYNAETSGTFTLDQLVATLQSFGLTELANAVQQAGQRNGMIGQVVGVWDTGDQCPDTVGLSLEVDLTLFQTPQGARAYLEDTALQQAWVNTGLFSDFQPYGGGVLASGVSAYHQCGTVQLFALTVPQGNVLVTTSVIGNAQASQEELLSALELLTQYMQQQLTTLGVQ